jgi:hypothetical protein
MHKIIGLAIALTIGSSGAHAKDYLAWGLGVTPCSRYLQLYRENPQMTDMDFGSWLQGYMTGMNVATQYNNKTYRNLATYSLPSMNKWMRQYCSQHPRDTFMTGVTWLGTKLPVLQMPESGQEAEQDIPYDDPTEQSAQRRDFR